MSGTKRYRHTRTSESRVSRLHRRAGLKGRLTRSPRLDYRLEFETILLFLGIAAATGALLAGLVAAGAVAADSDTGLMFAFSLGFIVTCALSSALAILVRLRHRLLLVALSAGAVAIGAVLTGWEPLEGLAKVVFATSSGLWIGLMLPSISQVLLISALIIVVDFYSVFMGPTKKIAESGGPWIDYLTVSLPVFGAPAVSRIGISDIIFFSVFVACTLTYRLRRAVTALAMTASFVGTMIVGIILGIGVPALPLLSLAFLLANADRLYRRFLEEPDEHKNGAPG